MLLDVRPRSRQPRTRSEIDWSHPLTRALRFAYTVDPARPFGDLVSGRNGMPVGVTRLTVTPHGGGLSFDLAGALLDFGDGGIPNAGGGPFSVFFLVQVPTVLAYRDAGLSAGGGQNAYAWGIYDVNLFLVFPGLATILGTSIVTAGHLYAVGITYSPGTGVRFFSRNLSTHAIVFETVATAALPGPTFPRSSLSGPNTWGGPLMFTYTFDRLLSDQEFLALSFEPYAFVRPVRPWWQIKHVWDTVPRVALPARERVFEVSAKARIFGVPATSRMFEMEGRRS